MKLEINDQLKNHLNQLKLNKQNVKIIKDEIRSESMKLFHFLMKQQIKLIKQTDIIEKKELELNLNYLINKENNLLNKLEFNLIEYNQIINNNNNNLKINFNYVFKTNENNLIIGHLLVFIISNIIIIITVQITTLSPCREFFLN